MTTCVAFDYLFLALHPTRSEQIAVFTYPDDIYDVRLDRRNSARFPNERATFLHVSYRASSA